MVKEELALVTLLYKLKEENKLPQVFDRYLNFVESLGSKEGCDQNGRE